MDDGEITTNACEVHCHQLRVSSTLLVTRTLYGDVHTFPMYLYDTRPRLRPSDSQLSTHPFLLP